MKKREVKTWRSSPPGVGWGGVLLDRTLVPPSFFRRQISLQSRYSYFAVLGDHHHRVTSKQRGITQAAEHVNRFQMSGPECKGPAQMDLEIGHPRLGQPG